MEAVREETALGMAMAMAVVGLVRELEIENPEVVNKSYPEFWKEMEKFEQKRESLVRVSFIEFFVIEECLE